MGQRQTALVTTHVATRSRHLRRQDNILCSKHLELREKLNVRAIFPYLNQFGLLLDCDQSKLNDGTLTEQERVDTILDSLTKCNKDNYLLDVIDCLKRSEYGTGEGHLELAQSLEVAYYSETETEDDSDYTLNVGHACKDKHYLNFGCVLVCITLLVLLLVIIVLGILSTIPRVNNDPGPGMVRPLLTNRPLDGKQTRVLEVDFGTDPFWVSQADFQIEDCTGVVLIIQGIQCHDLPQSVIEHTDPLPSLNYAYLLQGSVVNITIADTIDNSEVQVWALNSEGWQLTDMGKNLGSCNDPPPGTSCFLAQSKAGQTIQQEIEKADFYFYFLTDVLSFPDVSFTYVAEQYLHNLTEIRKLYSPTETAIIRDRSQSVTISPAFDFQQRKCIMLSSSCPGSTQSHTIIIGNLRRRMDVLIFPGVVGIIALLLLVASLVLSVCMASDMWPKLKGKCKSKFSTRDLSSC